MHMSNNDIPIKEMGEMLDMVSTKLPALIKEIQSVLFSEEGAATMSKAVGTFYKNLVDSGMNEEDALRLTQEYMSTLQTLSSQFQNS